MPQIRTDEISSIIRQQIESFDVDLRVDVHREPVGELRRVFDAYRPAIPYYNLRPRDPTVPSAAGFSFSPR